MRLSTDPLGHATYRLMTLEDLADLIHANSANTNGRIDGLDGRIDAMRNETNAALMNIQNDLTDVRSELKDVRHDLGEVKSDLTDVKTDLTDVKRSLDLTSTVATMRREIDALVAEVAELKRRAS